MNSAGKILALACAAGACACHSARHTPGVTLGIYADAKHKVSFQFPPPWTLATVPPSSLPEPLFSPEHLPSAVVSIGPETKPALKNTDFKGGEFLYAVRSSLSPAACAALARSGGAVLGTGQVTTGGAPFTYAESSDSGMSHLRDDRVYTTLHEGSCYIFDLALLRAGAGASPGIRAMTKAEQSQVENEMQQILSSVSFHS